MTGKQKDRIAQEIMGWMPWGVALRNDHSEWLWPLQTALMERGWTFKFHGKGKWEALNGWADASCDSLEGTVNAAALLELERLS